MGEFLTSKVPVLQLFDANMNNWHYDDSYDANYDITYLTKVENIIFSTTEIPYTPRYRGESKSEKW